MKRKLALILVCTLLLTGCWDRKELNELGIVVAMALDKDDNTGNYLITAQVVRPEGTKSESRGTSAPAEIVTASGATIFEALRNISTQFDRHAYFAHNKIVVIDEEIAKEGLIPIVDFLLRSHEIRLLTWLVVTKDVKAREILGIEHGIEIVQAAYLEGLIRNSVSNSKTDAYNVLSFIKPLLSNEINPVAGVMEVIEQPIYPIEQKSQLTTRGVQFSGLAVFKKDKLVGYLDPIETRGFNWVAGNIKSGTINVPVPGKEDKLVTIEITRASRRIEPQIKDGKFSFVIKIKEEGVIIEEQGLADVSKLEIFNKIQEEQKHAIEKEVEVAVDKLQKEFGSDILGFGRALDKKYPKEWKRVKDNWENLFPEVAYTVEVDASIRRTGLLLGPTIPSEK